MTRQEQEHVTYRRVMERIAHELLVYLKTGKPGTTMLIAFRPSEEGFGCAGKIVDTMDPANAETFKALQELETHMQDALFDAIQQKGTA